MYFFGLHSINLRAKRISVVYLESIVDRKIYAERWSRNCSKISGKRVDES